MINIPSPSLDIIQELFEYLPEYGVFVYKRKVGPIKAGEMADFRTRESPIHRVLTIRKKEYQACRVAYHLTTGVDPCNGFVYHANGDVSDNRPHNLRYVSEEL